MYDNMNRSTLSGEYSYYSISQIQLTLIQYILLAIYTVRVYRIVLHSRIEFPFAEQFKHVCPGGALKLYYATTTILLYYYCSIIKIVLLLGHRRNRHERLSDCSHTYVYTTIVRVEDRPIDEEGLKGSIVTTDTYVI